MARRVRPQSLLAPCAAALAAACADGTPVAPTRDGVAPALALVPVRAARYMVQFSGRAPTAISSATLAAAGAQARVAGSVASINALVVANVTNASALLREPGAVAVEESPDVYHGPTPGAETNLLTAFDPATAPFLVSGIQWNIKTMKADQVWANTAGGQGVKVCVVDSGIDESHRELVGKVVARTSLVPNDPADATKGFSDPAKDSVGHGSHVAGTVSTNNVTVAGVAPNASLMTAKVFAATGGAATDRVLNAVKWCTDNGADVINASLGSIRLAGSPGIALFQAGLDYASTRGVIVVVSAGNDNLQVPNPVQVPVPSMLQRLINVGATGPISKVVLAGTPPAPALATPIPNWDPRTPASAWQLADHRALYSNFGAGIQVYAPGGNLSIPLSSPFRIQNGTLQGADIDGIYSVCSGSSPLAGVGPVTAACLGRADHYVSFQGTSMAAPHVAGLAAILRGEIGGARTVATANRVMACIRNSADVVAISPESGLTGPRVNAKAAVDLLKRGGC